MRRLSALWIAIGVLTVLTGIVFFQVLRSEFVMWDDDILLYRNPNLDGLSAKFINWAFTERHVVRYQPLTWLVWGAAHEFQNGTKPFGFHLVSLLGHLANVLLVFWLLLKLLRIHSGTQDRDDFRILCATLGAAFWAVHPLRVETVAWASAYLHVQATFFILLATLCYVQSATAPHRWRWYIASVASYACSALSYPTGLGFAIVPIVLDVVLLRRERNETTSIFSPRWWLNKIPYVLIAALILGITLYRRVNVDARWQPVAGMDVGMFPRMMQAFYIWAYYFWKTLLPANLSPIYDTLISFRPTEPRFVLSAVGVIGSLAVLVWKKSRRWILGVVVCYLILMVPMLGLTERTHFPSDRYSYMAGVCWSVLLAGGLWSLRNAPSRRMAMAGMSGIVGLLAVMSFLQAGIWRNNLTLFTYAETTIKETSTRASICRRLGLILHEAGRFEKAIPAYEEYLRFNSQDAPLRARYATALFAAGQSEKAKREYAQAINERPNNAAMRNNFGLELASVGDLNGALAQFESAIQLNPEYRDAYHNAAEVLKKLGRTEEAQSYLDRVQKLNGAR